VEQSTCKLELLEMEELRDDRKFLSEPSSVEPRAFKRRVQQRAAVRERTEQDAVKQSSDAPDVGGSAGKDTKGTSLKCTARHHRFLVKKYEGGTGKTEETREGGGN